MKTIALIPARSGSKGIPRKNLRILGDKSLLEWSIDAALVAGCFDAIEVSAGSERIKHAAWMAGAGAFLRPDHLNGDLAPMIEVVKDAIFRMGLCDADIIALLQPTAPFRSVESIQRCVDGLKDSWADSCMTIIRVPDRYHPRQLVRSYQGPFDFPVNRQDLTAAHVRAGTVYAFRVGTVRRHDNIYGKHSHQIAVPESEALNLDEMADWHEAERRVKNRTSQATAASSVQGQEQAQPAAV